MIGVESAVSRGVSASLAAGRVVGVEVGDTFADGLPGNLEPGCVTPEVIGDTARLTSVTDDQIRTALRWLFHEHGLVAEGRAPRASPPSSPGRPRSPAAPW